MENDTWPPTPTRQYRVEHIGGLRMEFDDHVLRCTNTYFQRVAPFLCVWILCIPAFSTFGVLFLTTLRHPAHNIHISLYLLPVAVETLVLFAMIAGVWSAAKRSPRSPFHGGCVIDNVARTLTMENEEPIALGIDTTLLLKIDRPSPIRRYFIRVECPRLKGPKFLHPAIGLFFKASDAERAILEIANFTGLKVVNEISRKSE